MSIKVSFKTQTGRFVHMKSVAKMRNQTPPEQEINFTNPKVFLFKLVSFAATVYNLFILFVIFKSRFDIFAHTKLHVKEEALKHGDLKRGQVRLSFASERFSLQMLEYPIELVCPRF